MDFFSGLKANLAAIEWNQEIMEECSVNDSESSLETFRPKFHCFRSTGWSDCRDVRRFRPV